MGCDASRWPLNHRNHLCCRQWLDWRMNILRLIARVIGRPLDSCQSGFLIVDFVFFLVEIGVNTQIPWAKHIRVLKSDNSVKARTPALDYVSLRTVIEWIMVAHVDSSDCRCRCIGKIIARDLRLVASRLYHTGVTQPWTRHVPCHYSQQSTERSSTRRHRPTLGSWTPEGMPKARLLQSRTRMPQQTWLCSTTTSLSQQRGQSTKTSWMSKRMSPAKS